MAITVTVDISGMRRQLLAIGDKAPLAAARALNRSIASVQTAAVRDIASDLKLAQKDVRKGMTLERATRQTLRARLIVTGRRLALHAFRARPTRAGVSYDLGRGRTVAPGAFIATMRSRHIGVFRRRDKRRLPIDELFGPSLPHVFTAARISAARAALAADLLRKNLTHEVEFLAREVK